MAKSTDLDKPKASFASDFATQAHTAMEQLRARHGKMKRNIFEACGEGRAFAANVFSERSDPTPYSFTSITQGSLIALFIYLEMSTC